MSCENSAGRYLSRKKTRPKTAALAKPLVPRATFPSAVIHAAAPPSLSVSGNFREAACFAGHSIHLEMFLTFAGGSACELRLDKFELEGGIEFCLTFNPPRHGIRVIRLSRTAATPLVIGRDDCSRITFYAIAEQMSAERSAGIHYPARDAGDRRAEVLIYVGRRVARKGEVDKLPRDGKNFYLNKEISVIIVKLFNE